MLIKLIKSVNFKEVHVANHLMHVTETFAVKLLQIFVSDVSPKQVLACILLIGLTKFKIINFSWVKCNKKCTFMTSKIHRGSSVNQKGVKCKQP